MKKVGVIFGIYEYFVYICNVIYSCSLFEDKLLQLIQFIILIIWLNCPFVRNRQFQEVTSELPLFLFMYYAVGLAIMVFITSQESYLPLSGIVYHMKDFNAL